MQFIFEHKILSGTAFIVLVLLALIVFNIVYIINSGSAVPIPDIPRQSVTIGAGAPLRYLVLGDSTTISQGGSYENGYVVGTADKLAESYKVTYQNFGESGATIKDVLQDQLTSSAEFTPDLVLIAAGSNDVTHLTSLSKLESYMKAIISELRTQNSQVRIVFTGSGAMGTVQRFAQPLRWLAGKQTKRINAVMERVAKQEQVTFGYIARETEEKFADNPQYLAADKFHPNDEGYAQWTIVLNKALATALQK